MPSCSKPVERAEMSTSLDALTPSALKTAATCASVRPATYAEMLANCAKKSQVRPAKKTQASARQARYASKKVSDLRKTPTSPTAAATMRKRPAPSMQPVSVAKPLPPTTASRYAPAAARSTPAVPVPQVSTVSDSAVKVVMCTSTAAAEPAASSTASTAQASAATPPLLRAKHAAMDASRAAVVAPSLHESASSGVRMARLALTKDVQSGREK